MKRIEIFKTVFISILSMLSTITYGQEKLIYSEKALKTVERTSKVLQKSEAYTSVDFVKIDLEKILNHERFALQFEEKNISVAKERIEVRGINNFCFVGKDDNGTQIVMSVLDGDIQ